MIRSRLVWFVVIASVLGGCGYSAEELDAAFRDGHRAGIIWCKRQDPLAQPDLDAELLDRWQAGFRESTSLQCAASARKLEW